MNTFNAVVCGVSFLRQKEEAQKIDSINPKREESSDKVSAAEDDC